MTRSLHGEQRYPAGAGRLLALVSDPEFLVAQHRAQGAVSAHVREVSRDASTLVQEVETQERTRTMRGVHPNKTEAAWTRYEWELERKRGRWRYRGSHGKLLRIEGRITVVPDGDAHARLLSDFEVEVRAPLIGGLIEKRIVREIGASLPRLDAPTSDRLTRADGEAP